MVDRTYDEIMRQYELSFAYYVGRIDVVIETVCGDLPRWRGVA